MPQLSTVEEESELLMWPTEERPETQAIFAKTEELELWAEISKQSGQRLMQKEKLLTRLKQDSLINAAISILPKSP